MRFQKYKVYDIENQEVFFVNTDKDEFLRQEGNYSMNGTPERIYKHIRNGKEIIYALHHTRGSITGTHYIKLRTDGFTTSKWTYEDEIFKKRKAENPDYKPYNVWDAHSGHDIEKKYDHIICKTCNQLIEKVRK